MPLIKGPDGEIHLTTFEDASTALCGAELVPPDAVEAFVSCQGCVAEEIRRQSADRPRRHKRRHP